ncbi:dTDP-4-amino-4,6-dideoxygalactose transaminase [Falsibacillus albus]|uniref:dTDP-4-amino-4,6-dideoxygalactose transaminase n=1 Tax=Falsibacillus albus TaxID=2478915 RepID=A0A3L7K117_9BACI|nr:dTDP-4-amino-4,6-dideoxygalactose transaminase [Falsibacillus albus]RLQ96777.1 dTDP-4-amino-4,6-dideoxygalactose transaminase [Falsibacillus albus]
MIPFHKPLVTGIEMNYLRQVIETNNQFSGDHTFTKKCSQWFQQNLSCPKVLLTPSCTHALEMAAILANIGPDDEVIMPSYTFVSTANAFVLRGAKIVFVDIRKDTMNIDEHLLEGAVTEKTKAIAVVHYAGVSCEMAAVLKIAEKYNLLVIEDAAQGLMSTYKGKALGTIGDLGCFSFHETKNYHCGEGGALLINRQDLIERAEIIREKGTNRSKFFRGHVDKYTWVDIGSSYLMSELNAAFLFAQLEAAKEVNKERLSLWEHYHERMSPLKNSGLIELPHIPEECLHNAHMFYIKLKDIDERTRLIDYLKKNGVGAVFHYIPLHSTEIGKSVGRFHGQDTFTTTESERLLRLPMFNGLNREEINTVVQSIRGFFNQG